MMKKQSWAQWAAILVTAGGVVAALVMAIQGERHAADSAEFARQVAEDTRAPVLDVTASHVRTPMPDLGRFIQVPGPDSVEVELAKRLSNSTGVWHVTVKNTGDAEATNVRIRAPGIFYARHVGYATGRRLNFKQVQNDEFPAEDLAPGGLVSVVLWVLPGFALADACEPVVGPGCFTKDDLKVFAENASGDVWVKVFDPGSVTRPEVTTPERDLPRWTPLKVILVIVWAATLILISGIVGMAIGRRSDKHRDDPHNDET